MVSVLTSSEVYRMDRITIVGVMVSVLSLECGISWWCNS